MTALELVQETAGDPREIESVMVKRIFRGFPVCFNVTLGECEIQPPSDWNDLAYERVTHVYEMAGQVEIDLLKLGWIVNGKKYKPKSNEKGPVKPEIPAECL